MNAWTLNDLIDSVEYFIFQGCLVGCDVNKRQKSLITYLYNSCACQGRTVLHLP